MEADDVRCESHAATVDLQRATSRLPLFVIRGQVPETTPLLTGACQTSAIRPADSVGAVAEVNRQRLCYSFP